MYGFLRGLSTSVFVTRLCIDIDSSQHSSDNHVVVLWELSWLPGGKKNEAFSGRDFRASALEFRK